MTQQTKKGEILSNEKAVAPPQSVYDLTIKLNNGHDLSLSQYKGKKIMFVNTASDCGYTGQYADLQKLYEVMKDEMIILGFPSNQFGAQEQGSDQEIASFCAVNYGVSFPIVKKSEVLPGDSQNSVYAWLTDPAKNGWNSQAPVWNFCKYIVDENGVLTHYVATAVSPLDPQVREALD